MSSKMKHVKMTGGADQVGTRVAHPIVYPSIALRPKGELIAPVLSFALVSGNPVVLEFAEQLDGDFVPATTDWDVQKNGGAAAVTSLVVIGTTVKLTMTVAIVQGDTLTVAYTRPTANTRLRDLRGNEVTSFTAQSVLNYTPGAADATVPALGLATVQGANMVLYFDEQLDPASVPAVTAFAVVIGGIADVVTLVAINGNVVRLTLTTAATYGQSATVAYTVPGANMLQDLAGNDVATFGATTALNYTGTTPDTQAPRFSFAIVNTTTIRMIYDEQLDTGSIPANTAFSIVVNGGAPANPSAVNINGDTVSLTITAVVSTDTVTVAYTAPGANMIQDLAGNDAASLGAQTCINVTTEPADTQVPRLSRIYGSGTNIVLDFDEQLTENSPTLSAFDVQVNGAPATESGVVVSGSVVTITIATGLVPGDTFTVAYTAGATAIQDLAGNVAANFGATAGANLSLDTQAPRLSYISGQGTSIKLHYDEPLTENTPTLSAFAVVVGGVGATETAVSVLGHIVDITISAALISTDTFTVAYTAGATPIEDRAGNNAANFGATAGENVTDRAVGGIPSTQDYSDAAAAGSSVTAPALDHVHGFPNPAGTYDAIIAASHVVSYWDDFIGRIQTVASSERYSTAVSGGTTPTFEGDPTTGMTRLRLGRDVNLTGEYTWFYFNTGTVRAAEDWGFKCIINETTTPTVGAGDIFYLVGFLEQGTTTADGIYFRSQDGGNWFLVCRDANIETTVDLGIAPDTITPRLLEFRITGDGASVQAYLSNIATGSAITTNIPTTALYCSALVRCAANITTAGEVALRAWGIQSGF